MNLNSATDESNVIVTIGNSMCNVTSLNSKQLTCKPPSFQPMDINKDGSLSKSGAPMVRVCGLFYLNVVNWTRIMANFF